MWCCDVRPHFYALCMVPSIREVSYIFYPMGHDISVCVGFPYCVMFAICDAHGDHSFLCLCIYNMHACLMIHMISKWNKHKLPYLVIGSNSKEIKRVKHVTSPFFWEEISRMDQRLIEPTLWTKKTQISFFIISLKMSKNFTYLIRKELVSFSPI